jgi:hypothetical protein
MDAGNVTETDFQTEEGRWFLFHKQCPYSSCITVKCFLETVVRYHTNQLFLFPKVMMTLKRRIFQDTEEDQDEPIL